MIKYCTNCCEGKDDTEYYLSSTHPGKRELKCKECSWSDKPKVIRTFVYYLPEEHYVGITKNLHTRMSGHSRTNNKIIDGFEVIGIFERHVDAHSLETMFHQRGYRGYEYEGC